MDDFKKIPPYNVEAEQSVLGTVFLQKEIIDEISEVLKVEDFYKHVHQIIYRKMLEIAALNEKIDIVILIEFLRRDDLLEQAGGIDYITSLANTVPTAVNALLYAQIVKDKSTLRRLINAGQSIIDISYKAEEDIDIIKDKAEQAILSIDDEKAKKLADKNSLMIEIFENFEKISASNGITGLESGFKDIDFMTKGFQNNDLIFIAARPSMGKTALVLNIAANVALRQFKPVLLFSLEMSATQLLQRIICAECKIDIQAIKNDKECSWAAKVCEKSESISSSPLEINDNSQITVSQIRSVARKMKAKQGLSLIVIDYIQLMSSDSNKKNENRQQEMTAISRSLKLLARELNVPIIVLSQLSRSVESRQVKKPMLSDLRESGALEQDADIVAFLYREDYYNPETERKNITEFIIAKHRNGPVGSVELFFHKEFTKFSNLARG